MSLLPYVMSELRDLSMAMDRPWLDDVVPQRRWCHQDDDIDDLLDDALLYEARPSTLMRLMGAAPARDSLVVRPRHTRRPPVLAVVRGPGNKKQLKKCLAEKRQKDQDEHDAFNVGVDVRQYRPEELSVQVLKDEGCVVVEGKHEERLEQPDEHGYVLRQFSRRFKLPASVDPDTIVSRLSADGVLQVTAPRREALPSPKKDNVRLVPIAHAQKPAVEASAETGHEDKETEKEKDTVNAEAEQ